MKKVYDLTTKSGLDKALDVLKNDPGVVVAKYAYEFVKDFFSSNNTEKQNEAAKALIEEGKRSGVDEMEIVLNNTKGFKLNIPLEGGKIDTALGNDGKIHVKVKFKKEEPIRPLLESGTDNDSQKSSALSKKNYLMIAALVLLLLIVCVLVCYIIFAKQ